MSSGRGEIPHWRYSPRPGALRPLTRCNSGTNGIVRMEEDVCYNYAHLLMSFNTWKAFRLLGVETK